ncbi:protein N-lysine methyltransferase METTL21A-like isoform X1 [Branchiostoma lanceolatum]|uniref:protein N-lysine methyltransferase METTL21A-like isoform X1 n=2 Tax=Branchiostoma lanceolatum TaxID=7740 RepID=UPI003455FC8D
MFTPSALKAAVYCGNARSSKIDQIAADSPANMDDLLTILERNSKPVPYAERLERAREMMRTRRRRPVFQLLGREIAIWESDVGEETDLAIGKRLWPGGVAFAEFLESGNCNMSFEDKKVIELGAGTGLVGIALSFLGADVTLTDLPDIISYTEENVLMNTMDNNTSLCRYTPKVRPLTWGRDLAEYPRNNPRYDYVIGMECVYIEPVFNDLIATIKHLSDENTVILIGYYVRIKQREENFRKLFFENFNVLSELAVKGRAFTVLMAKLLPAENIS